MTEVNPPTWLQDGCYTAEEDRALLSALVCTQGIVQAGDLLVTTPASGLSVSVAAGSAFVEGTVTASQGMYMVKNDALKTVLLSAADPSHGRIDLIIARVYDSQYAGALDQWSLEVVTGTPSASPAVPSAPASSFILAQVAVAAGATNVSGDATDERSLYGACGSKVIGARYSIDTSVSIPDNSFVNVPLHLETSYGDIFSLSGNAVVIPEDGVWMVSTGFQMSGLGSGRITLALLFHQAPSDTQEVVSSQAFMSVAHVSYAQAGDQINLNVGNLATGFTIVSGNVASSYLSVFKIA